MRFIIVAFITLFSAFPVVGQWGRGGCAVAGPVGPYVTPVGQFVRPVWHKDPEPGGWWFLFEGHRQLGAYHPAKGYFPKNLDGSFRAVTDTPVPLPEPRVIEQKKNCDKSCPGGCLDTCNCQEGGPGAGCGCFKEKDGKLNFGMEWMPGGAPEKITIGGAEVSKKRAIEAIEKGERLPDDAGKFRLVVVGTEAECGPVLKDFEGNPRLKKLTDAGLMVYSYRPDHWHVAGYGRGNPSITLVAPDKDKGNTNHGKDILHVKAYPGAEQLAMAIESRTDPNYDPNKSPGINPSLPSSVTAIPWWGWVLLAVGGYFLYTTIKQKQVKP